MLAVVQPVTWFFIGMMRVNERLRTMGYSTVFGQRATLFYSPTYGPAYLYDYQGRGRTYTLSWSMDY